MIRNVQAVRVTSSTADGAAPARFEHLRVDYVYGKRRGWPDDPASRDDKGVIEPPKGGAKIRAAGRIARTAEYCRLRDQGVSHKDAMAQVDVERRTGARYQYAWLLPQYCEFRRQGVPPGHAAARLGITPGHAVKYETDWQAGRAETGDPP